MLDEPLDSKVFCEREKKHLKEKQNRFGVKYLLLGSEVDHRRRVDFKGGEAMTFTSTVVKI